MKFNFGKTKEIYPDVNEFEEELFATIENIEFAKHEWQKELKALKIVIDNGYQVTKNYE